MSKKSVNGETDQYKLERARKNAELKNTIRLAKEQGVNKSIIHLLETYDKLNVDDKAPIILYEAATDKQINEFENAFNVKLPTEYCEFLKFSNGADLFEAGCIEFYGVDKNSQYSLYIYNENEYRRSKDMSEKLPDNLLIIGSNGEGCPICADLNTGEIIFWDIEMDDVSCLGSDFFDYLEEDVIDYMEWEMRENGK